MDKAYAASASNGLMNAHAKAQLPPATCFTRLDESISQLRNVRNRVAALADTLAGSAPESPCVGIEKGCGEGRFDQIDQAAGDINELCDQITGHLNRIERRL